jgi:hypothetical protein
MMHSACSEPNLPRMLVKSYQGTHSSPIVDTKVALSVNGVPEITEAVSFPPFRPFQTITL